MDYGVHYTVNVAKFIIIPGNEVDGVVVDTSVSSNIKDLKMSITVKVTGDNLLLDMAQDAL